MDIFLVFLATANVCYIDRDCTHTGQRSRVRQWHLDHSPSVYSRCRQNRRGQNASSLSQTTRCV